MPVAHTQTLCQVCRLGIASSIAVKDKCDVYLFLRWTALFQDCQFLFAGHKQRVPAKPKTEEKEKIVKRILSSPERKDRKQITSDGQPP